MTPAAQRPPLSHSVLLHYAAYLLIALVFAAIFEFVNGVLTFLLPPLIVFTPASLLLCLFTAYLTQPRADAPPTLDGNSLWRRLRHTPLYLLLRGRATGQLDVAWIIDHAGLDKPVTQLVRDVVKRTRLTRSEKLDVARELIAHFHDAQQHGHTPEAAIASFGDVRQAARLIRRAKRRNRSLPHKARVLAQHSLCVLLALYVAAAIALMLDKPRPRVDYVALLNAPIEALPADQRGWPHYRDAILAMSLDEKGVSGTPLWNPADTALSNTLVRPGQERWPAAAAFLREHAEAIEQVRRGAALPAVGLTLGFAGHWTGDDAQALRNNCSSQPADVPTTDAYANDLVHHAFIAVLLPHLSAMRSLSLTLVSDAHLAIEDSDADRAIADVDALLGMAQQLRPSGILIEQLVAISMAQRAVRLTDELLHDHANLFTDAQWTGLAHRLAMLDDWDTLGFEGEGWMFEDFTQRFYGRTGRATPTGMRVLGAYMGDSSNSVIDRLVTQGNAGPALSPITAAAIAPRSEMHRMHRALMQLLQQDMRRSLRSLALDDSLFDQRVVELDPWRYAPLRLMMPSFGAAQRTLLINLAARRATTIAIAAELYRRDHGEYPADVAALVPQYLPRVYDDPSATAGPMLLTVTDAGLVVYGRGLDDDDDHGTPPDRYTWSRLDPDDAGDWVLYPAPIDD